MASTGCYRWHDEGMQTVFTERFDGLGRLPAVSYVHQVTFVLTETMNIPGCHPFPMGGKPNQLWNSLYSAHSQRDRVDVLRHSLTYFIERGFTGYRECERYVCYQKFVFIDLTIEYVAAYLSRIDSLWWLPDASKERLRCSMGWKIWNHRQ